LEKKLVIGAADRRKAGLARTRSTGWRAFRTPSPESQMIAVSMLRR
jgi:hypothetical protein